MFILDRLFKRGSKYITEEIDSSSFTNTNDLVKVTSELKNEPVKNNSKFLSKAIVPIASAIEITRDIKITSDQLTEAMILANGNAKTDIVDDSISIMIVAYIEYIRCKNVHIAFKNEAIAKEEHNKYLKAFELLGINVGLLTSDTIIKDRKEIYQSDITFACYKEFVEDYLRDRVAVNKIGRVQTELGCIVLNTLEVVGSTLVELKRDSTFDYSLAKKANELVVKMNTQPVGVVDQNLSIENLDCDYIVDRETCGVIITDSGYGKIAKHFDVDTDNKYESTDIIEQVKQSILAHNIFDKNKDYIVESGEVIPLENGNAQYGRRLFNGLHEAIEAKENLEDTKEKQVITYISLSDYLSKYASVDELSRESSRRTFNKIDKNYLLDKIASRYRDEAYADRDRILNEENVEDLIDKFTERYLNVTLADSLDVMTLIAENEVLKIIFESDEFVQKHETIKEDFREGIKGFIKNKFKNFTEEMMRSLERTLFINSLDKYLIEFLNNLYNIYNAICDDKYGKVDKEETFEYIADNLYKIMLNNVASHLMVVLITIPNEDNQS